MYLHSDSSFQCIVIQGLVAAKADFGGNAPEDDEAGATAAAAAAGTVGSSGTTSASSGHASNLNSISASTHNGGNVAAAANSSGASGSSSSGGNGSSSAGGDGYNPMSFGGNGQGFFVVKLLRASGHAAVFGIRSLYVGMVATEAHAALPYAPFTLVPRPCGGPGLNASASTSSSAPSTGASSSSSSGAGSGDGGDSGGGGGGAWSAQQVLLEVLLRDLVPMCAPVIAAARHNTAVRTNLGADRRPCALADGAF